jgi:hypothetical protein
VFINRPNCVCELQLSFSGKTLYYVYNIFLNANNYSVVAWIVMKVLVLFSTYSCNHNHHTEGAVTHRTFIGFAVRDICYWK